MRAFAWFFGVLVAAGLATALIAYPVYELTSQLASWPFHRVASRVAMLAAAGGLIWLCRHLGVGSKRALGYGLPWRRFVTVALISGIVGMATAAAGAALLLAMHWRIGAGTARRRPQAAPRRLELRHRRRADRGDGDARRHALRDRAGVRPMGGGFAHRAAVRGPAFLRQGAHSGRGAALGERLRSAGPILCAALHPALVFDSFAAWLAVGLVLSLTRVLTGNIAAAIGLHAGWVVVLRMLQEATAPGPGAHASAWVGKFDGLLGYWVLPWTAAIGGGAVAHAPRVGALRVRRKASRARSPPAGPAAPRDRRSPGSAACRRAVSAISPRAGGPPTPHRRAAWRSPHTPRPAAAAPCRSSFDRRACRAGTGTLGSTPSHSTSPRCSPSVWRLRARIRNRCRPTQERPSRPSANW